MIVYTGVFVGYALNYDQEISSKWKRDPQQFVLANEASQLVTELCSLLDQIEILQSNTASPSYLPNATERSVKFFQRILDNLASGFMIQRMNQLAPQALADLSELTMKTFGDPLDTILESLRDLILPESQGQGRGEIG